MLFTVGRHPVTGMNLVRGLRAVWRGARRLAGGKASLVQIALTDGPSRPSGAR